MELYINDFKVDINERLPFPLTYSISDVKDLSARKGNNSKTISLPGTKGNLFLMYNAFSLSVTQSITGDVSSFDFDPSVKVSARYYEQGLLQFNGYCQLTDCEYLNGEWSFNVVLFSDQIDYISRLSKIKINELDWSEYIHDCTRDNQTDSWAGTIQVNGTPTSNKTGANWDGIGYYYGLIDYGFSRADAYTFNVEHIAPQVFCYDILKKAFEYCDISWTSTFLESQTFKRMLMAYQGGAFTEITAAEATALSAYNDELNRASGSIMNTGIALDGPWQIIFGGGGSRKADYAFTANVQPVWVDTVTDPSSQVTQEVPFKFQAAQTGVYTIDYSGDHDITFDFAITGATILDAHLRFKLRLLVYKNSFNIVNDIVYQGDLDNATGDVTGTVSFNYTRQIDMTINDELEFRYAVVIENSDVVVSTVPTAFSTVFKIANVDATFNILKNAQAFAPGSTINLGDFLPDMDAATFMKGFVTAFNLYVKPSVDDPTILEIEPLNDFYGDSSTALNWTDKLDYSRSLKVTPTINFASSAYQFKFAQDTDYYNSSYKEDTGDQYGSFMLESQNQFSKDTTEFTLPFAQKLLVNIPVDDVTYTNIVVPRSFQAKVNEDGTSSINVQKGKPFVVQLGPMTTANWNHIDEDGILHAESSYPYVGHLNSLTSPTFDFNFGVPDYIYYDGASYTTSNLYFYHETFMKEIVSKFGKQLTCYIKITPDMINLLDFKKLINIDGIVYRLQKIENWDSGKDQTTMVELIRIIKGEGLVAFGTVPPVDPVGSRGARILETGGVFAVIRSTEDGLKRMVE
jgi:hypothetical protein